MFDLLKGALNFFAFVRTLPFFARLLALLFLPAFGDGQVGVLFESPLIGVYSVVFGMEFVV